MEILNTIRTNILTEQSSTMITIELVVILIVFVVGLFRKMAISLYRKWISEFLFNSFNVRRKKMKSIGNEIISLLKHSTFYTKNNSKRQYLFPKCDLSSINENGIHIKLNEILKAMVSPGYEENCRLSNKRSKNVIVNELNSEFPEIFKRLVIILDRGYAEMHEIEKLF